MTRQDEIAPVDDWRLELGEGPGYDPATDLAWWFDIAGRRLFTRVMTGGETQVQDLPVAASAMAMTRDGHRLVLTEHGLHFLDPRSGALTLHLPLEADNAQTRSNDARVHPSGAFWISTMAWDCAPGAGSFYHYFRGRITPLWQGITIPNAICFAPDGTLAYFTDTVTGRLMRVATDPADGRPQGEPQVFASGFGGGPDGAVTDAAGNVWIAVFGAGEVVGLSPDGAWIGACAIPAANVTCPAFVGRDARTLLVTSARRGLSPEARRAAPQAGATFLLSATGVTGRFDPPVAT